MKRRWAVWWVWILLVGVAWAGDPWKDKPPAEWTMEDVQKILSDSPWVKTDFVDAPWIKGDPHYVYSMPPGCPGRPSFEAPHRKPPGWNVAPMTTSVVGYQVTWNSARTVRAARFRLNVLCDQADPEDEEEALEREPDDYLLSVQSADMRPFEGMDEEALTNSTYLLLKKTKTRVQPSGVRIAHGPDRRAVFLLVFAFPKNTDSGQPTLSPDEKEIEFVCQAGKVVIKTKFQLSKMAANSGLDL
jgi:hypothetical protein